MKESREMSRRGFLRNATIAGAASVVPAHARASEARGLEAARESKSGRRRCRPLDAESTAASRCDAGGPGRRCPGGAARRLG